MSISGPEHREVAEWLLEKGFTLTALELFTELMEKGEDEVPILREYFSDASNFSSLTGSSLGGGMDNSKPGDLHGNSDHQAMFNIDGQSGHRSSFTRDSIDDLVAVSISDSDANRMSTEDHVAVLSYELRQAHDIIGTLRARLTAEPNNIRKDYLNGVGASNLVTAETISQNMLSCGRLVKQPSGLLQGEENESWLYTATENGNSNAFLRNSGASLTSVTYSEEVPSQDLENWNDVGVNVCCPGTLLDLVRRGGYRNSKGDSATASGLMTVGSSEDTSTSSRSHDCSDNKGEGLNLSFSNERTAVSSLETLATKDITIHRLQTELEALRSELELITRNKYSEAEENTEGLVNADISNFEEQKTELESPELINDSDTTDTSMTEEHLYFSKHLELNIMLPIMTKSLFVASRNELSVPDPSVNPVPMLSEALLSIAPHVILKKRSLIVPPLLCLLRHHPDPEARDKLTHLLFTLIKKPDQLQRQYIMSGCMALAEAVGSERVETELLPQCWEQLHHRYPERRTLVADSCGALGAYVPAYLCSSLLVSILKQQCTDDPSELVRAAAVRNLALVVLRFDTVDVTDKLSQITNLLLDALSDDDDRVIMATRNHLLPAISFASARQPNGLAALISRFTGDSILALKKETTMKKSNRKSTINEGKGIKSGDLGDLAFLRDIPEGYPLCHSLSLSAARRVAVCLSSLIHVLPLLLAELLLTAPFVKHMKEKEIKEEVGRDSASFEIEDSSTAIADNGVSLDKSLGIDFEAPHMGHLLETSTLFNDTLKLEDLRAHFDSIFTYDSELTGNTDLPTKITWPPLEWLSENFIPSLVTMAGLVDILSSPKTANLLTNVLACVCVTLGPVATQFLVAPHFKKRIDVEEEDAAIRVCLLPAYVLGVMMCNTTVASMKASSTHQASSLHSFVLSADVKEDVVSIISDVLRRMAEGMNNWSTTMLPCLTKLIDRLCALNQAFVEMLTNLLWDLLVHPDAKIRVASGSVFVALIKYADSRHLISRLLPAFVTLSSDSDVSVRCATVGAFGTVLQYVTIPEAVKKVNATLTGFLHDNDETLVLATVSMLVWVIPIAEPEFRIEFVLPELVTLTSRCLYGVCDALLAAVIDALHTLSLCFLSEELVVHKVLPALIDLETCSDQLDATHSGFLHDMRVDAERKAEARNENSQEVDSSGSGLGFFSSGSMGKLTRPRSLRNLFGGGTSEKNS